MSEAKIPITILVPTINAEAHMDELLDSVQSYFEDVIVVDSLSLDKTVDICLRRGVKIVQRPFETSSDQFGWMLTKLPVLTPWKMILAQDERVTEGLREEMRRKVVEDSPHNGFTVQWRLWFMGHPLHAKPVIPRVFRVGKAMVTQVTCNEHFGLTEGTFGHLDGIVEHKDTPTLWDWYEKQNLYSTREAIGIVTGRARVERAKFWGTHNERRHWLALMLPRLPLGMGYVIKFLGYYLIMGGWKDGIVGWRWACCRTWVMRVTQLKVKEMNDTGVVSKMPEARHGDFDSRVICSDIQKVLLPEIVVRGAV